MAELTSATTHTLEVRRTFPAARERVFRAWTEEEALKRWKAPPGASVELAEVDLRVGGRYRVHMRAEDGTPYHVSGVYREIDPPRRLVFTWQWQNRPDEKETLVTVDFVERGSTTEVVLTHSLFESVPERDGHHTGWTGSFDKLAQVLA